MRVTYTPDGEAAKSWDWDPDRVTAVEAEAIERKLDTDVTWEKFRLQVMQGSARARRVLLWHLLKRDHPPLRLDDVDFRLGELEVEMDRAELTRLREQVAGSRAVEDEQRETMLRLLDGQIADAPEAPGGSGGSGKARSRTAADGGAG